MIINEIVHPSTVGQLLALVRAAIWDTATDTEPFTGVSTAWNEIGRLAMLQTVGPLAVKGAITLPAELRPPKEWLHKGYALIERNRHTHALLDSCVAESFARLSEAGISPILLKGQAYASTYPEPTLRQCGDIDIYVGPDNYRAAYEASRRYGWESEYKFLPEMKHYGCTLRGVKIELHKNAVKLISHNINKLFNQWCPPQLTSGRQSISLGGETVAVPTPLFDVIFSFTHMYHHFLCGGVGLRQLCDWSRLLHTNANNIDRQELEKLLKKFHLLKSWKIFTPIAVDYLGLPKEECPMYTPRFRRKAELILSFVVREGNFGRGVQTVSKRPKGYFRGKIYAFLHYSSRLYSLGRIDPIAIIKIHTAYIRNGIRQVIKDLTIG